MNKRYRGIRWDGLHAVLVEEDGKLTCLLDPKCSQKIRCHSPDGFSWGFGGSGPAQLALALLLDAGIGPDEAARLHQRFKWRHVASWADVWQLGEDELYLWVLAQPEYLEAVHQGGIAFDIDPTQLNGKPGMEPEVPDVK